MILYSLPTCGALDNQQYDDREPVEAVVDSGAGEGQLELAAVGHLRQRDQRARQAGADVRAHHHRDRGANVEDWNVTSLIDLFNLLLINIVRTLAGDHGHDDRCARGGALHEHGEQDADHEADDGVGEELVAPEDAA